MGETPAPERSEGERGGSHAYKGLKKTKGESMLEEEAPCDQLPMHHGQVHKNIYFFQGCERLLQRSHL
jgi:hypothetical protein